MGLGDRLLDPQYLPSVGNAPGTSAAIPYYIKTIKCPVKFTDDIIEYVVSKDFLGNSLRPLQRTFLEQLFYKNLDGSNKYDAGVLCVGMRGGKSYLAAFVVTFLTQYMLQFDQPATHFGQGPGTRLTAQTIASSSEQTKETVYAHVESIIHYSLWWQKYIGYLKELEKVDGKEVHYQEKRLEQEFSSKNISILSLHSNSAALAGKTSYCVVFDELSRFDVIEGSTQSKSQKRTADAVYSTASRAAASLKQISKVLTISSPMFEDDYTMKLLYMAKDCWVGEQATVINALRDKVVVKDIKLYGMHATTFEFNPVTPENLVGFIKGRDFESHRVQNPEAYKRDYLAIPPSTVNPYFEYPERIDQVVVINNNPIAMFSDKIIEESIQAEHGYEFRHYVGKTMLPLRPNKMIKYYICVDQGEVKDHFVLAMGHAEEIPIKTTEKLNMPSTRLKIIIDLLEGWVPDKEKRVTVSFENVEEVIMALNYYFLVGKVTYDAYSSVESIQRLFSAGIYTERLGATLEMYDVLKQLIYQGQIELPHNPRLIAELKHLSLIGGNRVDHDGQNCIVGDTKIKLLNGTCPTIKELVDKGIDNEFWVYAALPTGEIVPAKACNAHKTKSVMELCEVTLDNGEIIKTTLDHLYMLRDGSYEQAQELSIGESLMPLYTQIAKQKYLKGNAGNYEQIFFNNKWQYTHKVVSDYLGFGAKVGEVIHHNDLKQRNNSPENLERLTKAVHSQRHMQICRKAFTPEAIAKRVAAYKKTYWASEELQRKAKERAKILFNNPEIRAKISKSTKDYNIKNKTYLNFRKWLDSKEFREMLKERNSNFPKGLLVANANKLNNEYWKSPEGIDRRNELTQTQLVDARNKRTKESFIQGGKQRSVKACEELYSKIDYRFDYVLSYRHCVILYGGAKQTWKKVCPNIDFVSNAKKLIGKTDEEMLQVTGLSSRQLGVILSNLNMRSIFSKRNHKVVSVRIIKLDSPIDVYDITVPDYDNFAIDSGIFIHNSKDYSDAVVRCAWSCYTDYITQTIHGTHMLPLKASLPTIRSVATAYEIMNQNRMNPQGALWESFGTNQSLSGSGVFGDTIIVMPNVMPNIGKK